MKRKDMLAAGAKSATYAVTGKAGDDITIRNVMSEKDRKKADAETAKLAASVEVKKIALRKFIPTKGVLLVRQVPETILGTGLITTDQMEKEQPSEGTVLEVGPGSSIDVGAHVVFGKYAGAQFRFNGETLLLMNEDELKGFIVNE